ncbi:hypothetical protein MCOR29_000993 [Pyricularia oryzae]|nr:hypothetical protein MCOR29_000993 [Pyricularia oryzae]KAI6347091.1 hypothetical protein MCOR30_000408 [Pyricularia oryzae]KAI6452250.1 hypothetical protein MCOR22_000838 [Pyricularia oryzae]KAI6471941.1 hypothetical protein MCOR15_000700 [Pyricularia oryzae]KAI6504019.1 hypothetical protein MCOR11_000488 [Pyricularia oryzae]
MPQANKQTKMAPPKLPTVKLDTTLADLYRRASPSLSNKRVAQVLCGTNSGIALTSKFPRNRKYLYQDSPFNAADDERDTSPAARRTLAVKYLSLIPQRDAFIAGSGPVVMFNLAETDAQKKQDRTEAERTIAVLDEAQRPEVIFCPGPGEIPVEELGIDVVACKLMLDGLEGLPLVVPADVHWFLNSKAALAQSGLPTPVCEAVELEGHGGEAGLCCRECQQATAGFEVPALCEGERARWVEEQSRRVYDAVRDRRLPFVLKNQQTFGGAGTWMISTEAEREKLLDEFKGGVLRRLLSSVTSSNHHLKPGTILLSDMVAEPVGDYGVTFFVTEDPETNPIFLATSEQVVEGTAWIGSTIRYDRQDELKAKFTPLVRVIARWLRQHGYVGPAGADVLETAPHSHKCPESGGEGADFSHFHIVDLNVRTSGSLCLPLLRSHFQQRGMQSASSFSISTNKTRDEFMDLFREDFEAGNMLIVSWFEDRDAKGKVSSVADVAVGAKDGRELNEAIQKVRDATDEVTF